ncbi:hypothetical protein O0I10_006014 [Lichtheimia ornata]|uniref:Uncharacterized protein n=1 Tax=Lichtheimia ornata TaxID=688661 RepID=A0AAD7V653_9FUNG|nr:uncharacterized protein O0I10_006014 [Lichtheimia ornata]KAJ8658331.1 hypothetical protein O0I10_006014 [Lichtheimia ornata]
MPFATFFQSAASKKRASLSVDTNTHGLPPSPSSPKAAPNTRRWSNAIPSPSTDASSSPSTRRMRQRFSSLLSSNGSRKSFSVLSFDSLTSGSVDDNDHQPRYSSSSDESFHQPPTPPAHTDTTAITSSSYLMAKGNNIHPATIEEEPLTAFTSLAEQVRVVLGSALDEVDEEIELEWEGHRKNLRQSLLEPKRHLSLPLQL